MIAFLLGAFLTQAATCAGQERAAMTDAAARVQEFDVSGAIARLQGAATSCESAGLAAWYLMGLIAAREAYRDGGSAESLAPVKKAIAAVEAYGADRPGQAQIVRLVLLGASAAAQSERDEMAIFLDEARRQEALQIAANQPGAPLISAHEASGDLWLQVHRFDEARRAYLDGSELLGSTSRILIGLARTAVRLTDPSACAEYRRLIEWWGSRSGEPPEISEARGYLAEGACQPRPR